MVKKFNIQKFDYAVYPKRINMGCGYDYKEGYLNIDLTDFVKADLVADTTDLSMLPDSYYEEIYAKDVLEHIPRNKTEKTLKEWSRLLKDGGKIFIQTSNVINLAEMLKRVEYSKYEFQQSMLQCLFGTQAHEGDFHYYGFTASQLSNMMKNVGFFDFKLGNVDHWMITVTAKKSIKQDSKPEVLFGYGFYHEEDERTGFRWSQPESQLIIYNASCIEFTVECLPKNQTGSCQEIFYSLKDTVPVKIQLNQDSPTRVKIDLIEQCSLIKFESNYLFSPFWYEENGDKRKLSFFMYNCCVN